MSAKTPKRLEFYGIDEAAALAEQYPALRPFTNDIAEALRSAFHKGLYHSYRFTFYVKCPWGEMPVHASTHAKSYFDARRQVEAELLAWKDSQESLGRHDFPWLEQALEKIGIANVPHATHRNANDPLFVDIFWYDEREP